MTTYMIVALQADRLTVEAIYASVSITAPTLGVICGGIVVGKLGGYENERVTTYLLVDSCIVNKYCSFSISY